MFTMVWAMDDLFIVALAVFPPYTHLGDVEEIFNPLGVSLGASES
jgi:hypothetical protein